MPDAFDTDGRRRRQLLRALAATGVVGAGSTPVAGDSPSETVSGRADASVTAGEGDAPMLRYDAANTGHVPNGTAPTESVSAAWTFETGGAIRAQPVVVGGTAFVTSEDGRLYALDTETGSVEWSRRHDSKLTRSPVVANGIVYVPTASRLVAYSAATGDGQFAADKGSAVETPTVADGVLYVRIGNTLQALDAADGTVIWKDDLSDGYPDEQRRLAVTVTGDGVFVADGYEDDYSDNFDGEITKYARSDGTREWSVEFLDGFGDDTPPFDSTITAKDGTLYFGGIDAVHAYNQTDGSQKWQFDSLGKVRTYPVVSDGTVFVAAEDGLYAIDPAVGTSQWSVSVPGRPMSPVLVGDTLVLSSTDNNVYAFDTTGEKLWSFATGNDIVAPPIVVDGTVYVGSTDGVVYALTVDDGPTAPDVTGNGAPATDPDGDGVFEDVNGDGEFSIVDVQALFANLDSEAVQSNPELFDVNGDGVVDVTDVQALFAELQEG